MMVNMSHEAATMARYGGDEHGLICGYILGPDRPGQEVRCEQALRWRESSASTMEASQHEHALPEGSFVWLHFNLAHAAAQSWLREHAKLPDDYFEVVHRGSRSTRIERDGNSLLAVVNDVTFDFSFEASDVATLWASLTGRMVITARLHPLRAADRLRAAVRSGETFASPVALLDHLLRDQADELQRIVRTATERVDDAEDALLAGKHAGRNLDLPRMRRLMVRLQRLLAPEPSSLLRLLGNPPPWVSAADIQHLRQASEEFAVVLADIGDLKERIKLLQEEAAARGAEENNRTLFTLTMVTVLALPMNLTSGLLGMNVGGIPLGEHPHGFWLVLAFVVTLTLLVARYAFRRTAGKR